MYIHLSLSLSIYIYIYIHIQNLSTEIDRKQEAGSLLAHFAANCRFGYGYGAELYYGILMV